MTSRNLKLFSVAAGIFAMAILFAIGWGVTHETIGTGFVGYRYDKTIRANDERAIPGTSVINESITGRTTINPFTQSIIKYPTTAIAKNWTRLEEGDNKNDMSMQIGSQEGKNCDADIYITVQAQDIAKIIKTFGLKDFNQIVDNDIYGLAKGKLSIIAQEYSVYDIQASRSEIQQKTFDLLSTTLSEDYGISLKRFEIGTLILPDDIQQKIDQKTEAINAVELAKLDRQRQDEINQKIVDEQKANSEKQLLQRQAAAEASAYEKKAAAEAELAAQEAKVKTAELQVEQARLEKEAELEKQKSYTAEYFRDKELDVQRAAVEAINPSIQTIITDSTGSGYAGLFGLKEILDSME